MKSLTESRFATSLERTSNGDLVCRLWEEGQVVAALVVMSGERSAVLHMRGQDLSDCEYLDGASCGLASVEIPKEVLQKRTVRAVGAWMIGTITRLHEDQIGRALRRPKAVYA